MYPDTDLPPLPVSASRWDRIRANLPTPPWEQADRLRALGIGEELMEQLLRFNRGADCLRLAEAGDCDPGRLAILLTAHWRRLERERLILPPAAKLDWPPAFFAEAPNEADLAALRHWAKTGGDAPQTPESPAQVRIERAIVEILAEPPDPTSTDPDCRIRYYAGRARERLAQPLVGRELMETLTRLYTAAGEETK